MRLLLALAVLESGRILMVFQEVVQVLVVLQDQEEEEEVMAAILAVVGYQAARVVVLETEGALRRARYPLEVVELQVKDLLEVAGDIKCLIMELAAEVGPAPLVRMAQPLTAVTAVPGSLRL
jgi:hypothetical protein